MTSTLVLRGASAAATAALVATLAGCGTPANPSAFSGFGTSASSAGASFGGTGTGGGTLGGGGGGTNGNAPFTKTGASNAQGAAAPNSALVVYVPHAGGDIEYSGAGGHRVTVTENTAKGTVAVTMDARLENGGRRIATSETAIPTTNLALGAVASASSTVYSTINMQNFVVTNPAVQTQVLVSRDAGAAQLTDAQYGTIYVMNGNPWPILNTAFDFGLAAYHTGNATAVNDMPNLASATYTGTFQGNGLTPTVQNPNQMLGAIQGDVTLNANFAAGTISGTIANVRANPANTYTNHGAFFPFDINVNATITGNSYQGTAAYAGTGTSTTAGVVNGAFYGPQAAETAGAVTVRGNVTVPGFNAQGAPAAIPTPVTVIGSYGARR